MGKERNGKQAHEVRLAYVHTVLPKIIFARADAVLAIRIPQARHLSVC